MRLKLINTIIGIWASLGLLWYAAQIIFTDSGPWWGLDVLIVGILTILVCTPILIFTSIKENNPLYSLGAAFIIYAPYLIIHLLETYLI